MVGLALICTRSPPSLFRKVQGPDSSHRISDGEDDDDHDNDDGTGDGNRDGEGDGEDECDDDNDSDGDEEDDDDHGDDEDAFVIVTVTASLGGGRAGEEGWQMLIAMKEVETWDYEEGQQQEQQQLEKEDVKVACISRKQNQERTSNL